MLRTRSNRTSVHDVTLWWGRDERAPKVHLNWKGGLINRERSRDVLWLYRNFGGEAMSDLDNMIRAAESTLRSAGRVALQTRIESLVSDNSLRALELEVVDGATAAINLNGFPIYLKPLSKGTWQLCSYWSELDISEKDGLFESRLLSGIGEINEYIARMAAKIGPPPDED